MNIGVIGSRDGVDGEVYSNRQYVFDVLDRIRNGFVQDSSVVCIISGGGQGVESFAIDWAESYEDMLSKRIAPRLKFFASDKEGNISAFRERNNNIIAKSDIMVFFWDGTTPLIEESLITAFTMGKPCILNPMI